MTSRTAVRVPGRWKLVERSRIRLLTGVLASVVLSGLSGCNWPPYQGPPARPYPPYHSGYYDYYYYPYSEVYFHLYSGWYYYRDHGRWLRARQPPPHIHLDQRHRHRLSIHEKTPWQRHDAHRRQYPPAGHRREYGPAERATPRLPGGAELERRSPSGIRRGSERDRGWSHAPSGGTSHAAPPRRTERRVPPPEPRRSVSPAGARHSPARQRRRDWDRDRAERDRHGGRQRNVRQRHERSNKEWWPHKD